MIHRNKAPARRTWRATWAALALLALAGCGGGGGGGAADGATAPPSTSTPVSPPVNAPQALALGTQNLRDVSAVAVGGSEGLLEVGQFAVDIANRARSAGAPLVSTQTCPNGGLMTVTVQDRDGNGRVSAGDRLVADMQDCGVAVLSSVLAGTVSLELSTVDAAPAEALRGTIDMGSTGVKLSDPGGASVGVVVRIFGALAVEWSRSDFSTSLRVLSSGADNLRVTGSSGSTTVTEAYRSIDITKALQFDEARSNLSLSVVMNSGVLGGEIAVSTPVPVRAYLNTYPETGRIEVRGASTAVLRLKPHFVTASEQFDAELDSNGDGSAELTAAYPWGDAAEGYLWWDGMGAPNWGNTPYSTQPYLATAFSYSVGNFTSPGVNDVFRLQFSRPPVAGTNLLFRFRDSGSTIAFDGQRQDVAATVVRQGALVLIRPSTSLRHARNYILELSTDGVNWGTGVVPVRDALGNTVNLFGFVGTLATADTLRAVITSSSQLLASATATLQLDATNSISTLRPIASYQWTQLGGTPLAFSAPQAASTTVSWGAAAPVSLENITVELKITDTAGETETARVVVSALNVQATGRVLYFRGAAGDYISAGKTVLASDSTGSWAAAPANSGYVAFSYNEPNFAAWWNLNFASADGTPLRVGAYENAVRAPFHGNQNGLELSGSGRGCNQIVGRFDVLEIGTDAQGVINKLAVDFEQHCENAQAPPLFGSLRINSSTPIRP